MKVVGGAIVRAPAAPVQKRKVSQAIDSRQCDAARSCDHERRRECVDARWHVAERARAAPETGQQSVFASRESCFEGAIDGLARLERCVGAGIDTTRYCDTHACDDSIRDGHGTWRLRAGEAAHEWGALAGAGARRCTDNFVRNLFHV